MARTKYYNKDTSKWEYADGISQQIDSGVSTSSTNPVQNKAITQYVNDKTVLDTQMNGASHNAVENAVIKDYVDSLNSRVDDAFKINKRNGNLPWSIQNAKNLGEGNIEFLSNEGGSIIKPNGLLSLQGTGGNIIITCQLPFRPDFEASGNFLREFFYGQTSAGFPYMPSYKINTSGVLRMVLAEYYHQNKKIVLMATGEMVFIKNSIV